MKTTLKTMATVILLLLAIACSKSPDPTPATQLSSIQVLLNGSWHGTYIYAPGGIDQSYPVNVAITTTRITITNTNTNGVAFYDYDLENMEMVISSTYHLNITMLSP